MTGLSEENVYGFILGFYEKAPRTFMPKPPEFVTITEKRVGGIKTTEPRVPHKVAVLAYDGLCSFEFGIVSEIFGLKRPELGLPLYDMAVSALETGSLKMQGGLGFVASVEPEIFDQADTIIIPGWRGPHADISTDIIQMLQRANARGARLVSICSGIYVLAAAGLLSGGHATTHWRYIDDFTQRYPLVKIDPDALYVEDGNIVTSAGSSAGIDACLHIVRQDYGAGIANTVARRLVMHAHREGGQAQFIERPIPTDQASGRISRLMVEIESNLSDAWSIPIMIAKTGMSKRTFQRKFTALTGSTPLRWLTGLRIDAARQALEATQLSLDVIAYQTGFSDADALHYHFQSKLGVTPSFYRKRFSKLT